MVKLRNLAAALAALAATCTPLPAFAQASKSLEVKEADGSPTVAGVKRIVVSNGTLTDNGVVSGLRQVTITTGGGGGGGLASTDIDTSAELRAILTDESGTGALLFQSGALGDATVTTLSHGGDPADDSQAIVRLSVNDKICWESATEPCLTGTSGGVLTLSGTNVVLSPTNTLLTSALTEIQGAAPTLSFDDTDQGGAPEVNLSAWCTTNNDCSWQLTNESGNAGTLVGMLTLNTVDAGTSTLYLGGAATAGSTPSNAITVDEGGDMTAIGTGSILGLATDGSKIWLDSGATPGVYDTGEIIITGNAPTNTAGDSIHQGNLQVVGTTSLSSPPVVASSTIAAGDVLQGTGAGTGTYQPPRVADGGTTNLTCGSTSQGKIQTMDDGTLQYCDGASTAVLRKGALFVATTADSTNTNTAAYTSLSELDFPVAASTKYVGQCHFIESSNLGTTGVQLQLQGPGSPTSVNIIRDYRNNNATAITNLQQTAFNSGSTDDGATGSCVTGACISRVEVVLDNGSNSGTLQWAYQPESNGGSESATIYKGSNCIWRAY